MTLYKLVNLPLRLDFHTTTNPCTDNLVFTPAYYPSLLNVVIFTTSHTSSKLNVEA